jgi:hypothetical protein
MKLPFLGTNKSAFNAVGEVDAYFSRTQVMHTRYRPVMS